MTEEPAWGDRSGNAAKNNRARLAMAAWLSKEKTLTIERIAGKVHLGTSKSANLWCHAWMKAQPDAAAPTPPQPIHDSLGREREASPVEVAPFLTKRPF